MYRTGTFRREMGMRSGPYTGGAVLVPWHAITLGARRKLLAARPIAHERPRIKTWTVFALAAIATLGLVFVSGNGFGQVDHRDLLQTRSHAILYGAFVAGIAVACALLTRRLFSGGSWLPWERAVLALDAVEATRRGLVVRPFGDARDVVFDDGSLEIRYADGSTFRILAPDGERIERDLLFAEGILTRASLSEDDSVRAEHDPLATLRDEKGFSHRAHAVRIGDAWTRPRELHPAFVALVILASFGVAVPLLELRNRWSDDAAFEYAHAKQTTRLYEDYLAHGSRHVVEVRDELLPRMVMSQLAMRNTDGVDDYLRRFPGARDAEVRGTLDRTCHALAADFLSKSILDYVRRLQSFVDEYPDCQSARPSLAAEHYDGLRLGLERSRTMPTELRDLLTELVTKGERTSKTPTLYVVRESLAGDWKWRFADRMHTLAGTDTAFKAPKDERQGAALVLEDEPVRCPRGSVPRAGVALVSVRLFVDDALKREWTNPVLGDFTDLFEAVTTERRADLDLCVRIAGDP